VTFLLFLISVAVLEVIVRRGLGTGPKPPAAPGAMNERQETLPAVTTQGLLSLIDAVGKDSSAKHGSATARAPERQSDPTSERVTGEYEYNRKDAGPK
jgi:hypothetical protein